MRRFVSQMFAVGLGVLLCTPALADDDAQFDIGNDAFRAGATVTHSGDGVDDLFMAGETITGASDIAGNAHLLGRRVTMSGDVGGDAYAAGMDVRLTGDVAGDASAAGYEVSVGSVGGDLRMSGAKLTLSGPVAGYALLAGDEIRIDGAVAGDVNLAGRSVDWGDGASIGGTLTLYEEDPGSLEVPASVIAEDRITREKIEKWDDAASEWKRPFSLWGAVRSFLMGVIVIAAIAALVAAVVPDQLAAMRRRVLDRPFGTLWLGFLALSTLTGSAILFAMTLIGLILTPASILIAVLTGFAGYVIGAYSFGVGLMLAFGRPEPDSIGERALAAALGAFVVGVIALIPFLGWLFVLAVTLAGAGAITTWLIRPKFFADV